MQSYLAAFCTTAKSWATKRQSRRSVAASWSQRACPRPMRWRTASRTSGSVNVFELAAVGVDRPKVTHLGTDPASRKPCRCRKRPFLVLFTTFLNTEPPLRCGACFGPVALYKVPATNKAGNHQDVLWWQDTYQAMDWLFIGTGPGERFAHEQLSRFDSELSTDGRELARRLENKVRLPVYYYLSKHFGRSDQAERKRKCPSCGKAWLRKEPLYRIFDFQCQRCRLLSNMAFDVRLSV